MPTPVYADGKLLLQGSSKKGSYGDGSLVMLSARGKDTTRLGRAKIAQTLGTSPALVNGRLYCRLKQRIACYDLAQASSPLRQPEAKDCE